MRRTRSSIASGRSRSGPAERARHQEAVGRLLARIHRVGADLATRAAGRAAPPDDRDDRDDRVISHRDLDPKNVVWTPAGTPVAVDWEAAGLVDPATDVVAVAMDWSGLRESAGAPAAVEPLLRGYVAAAGPALPAPSAAAVRRGYTAYREATAEWLRFNTERAVNAPSAAERSLAAREARRTAAYLRRLGAQQTGWVERLVESLAATG